MKLSSAHFPHYRISRIFANIQVLRTLCHMSTSKRYWLLKAEPDTRIVKGKDVRVSNLDATKRVVATKHALILDLFGRSLAWTTLNALGHRPGRASGIMKRVI